jgi:hypothetical protein
MAKHTLARKGTNAFSIQRKRVREMREKHPQATKRQIQNYAKKDLWKFPLKYIPGPTPPPEDTLWGVSAQISVELNEDKPYKIGYFYTAKRPVRAETKSEAIAEVKEELIKEVQKAYQDTENEITLTPENSHSNYAKPIIDAQVIDEGDIDAWDTSGLGLAVFAKRLPFKGEQQWNMHTARLQTWLEGFFD